MQIATDNTNTVRLVGDELPTEWNGLTLTIHSLTEEQEAQYKALRDDRASTQFDGEVFTAIGTVVRE
jgi:Spy/CpxP family protein refolding chaperone